MDRSTAWRAWHKVFVKEGSNVRSVNGVVHRVRQYSDGLQDVWLECAQLRRQWEGLFIETSDPVDCIACLTVRYRA